jgi:exopolysaccharide biosynthesis polyprenyl glycosylphosphotransferase
VQAQQYVTELVRDLQALPVNIRFVPDVFDLAFLHVRAEDFGGMPLLSLKEPTLDPFQRLTKRIFDLVLASLLLIPALPLMAVIAAAVKLNSPGPVLFKQERVGEGGCLFGMYKFRSMIVGAEQHRDEVVTVDDEGNMCHKHSHDPRVTRVGHFLRHLSLDEIPQLFNVLKGEMSLVGPRPEMPWLVEKYEPWQRKRFDVPQGVTGWWQVNGRSQPMYMCTEEDLFYIRNYSLWLDIRILWRTIEAAVSGRGAY